MLKYKVLPILIMLSAIRLFPVDRLTINVSGNYLLPSNDDFRYYYEKVSIYPELKIGYRIAKKIYIWGSYSYLSARCIYYRYIDINKFQEIRSTLEYILSLGVGYQSKLTDSLSYSIEIGFFSLYTKLHKVDDTSNWIKGFQVNTFLTTCRSKNFYAGIFLGVIGTFESIYLFNGFHSPIQWEGIKSGLLIGVRL